MVVGDYSTPGKVVSAEDVSEKWKSISHGNPFRVFIRFILKLEKYKR